MPNDDDIRAKTPDGVIHRFPVGTPPPVVDGAIKKYLSAKSTGVDLGELQQRTLGQARATAAAPIVSGELNNPASPNFNRPLPGSFEGKPENVGEYIPASAGEMAGGSADIASGNVARGTHRIIGGASNALLPVLPFASAAAPIATARMLAGGQLGSMAGKSIGEGIGLTPDQSDVAGDIGGLAAGYGAAKIPAARAAIARQLYTADQAFKPGVSTGARVAGGSLGSLTGGTIGSIAGPAGTYGGAAAGGTAGAALGPTVLGKAFPPPPTYPGARLPLAEDFYAARAEELMARGKAQEALDAKFMRQGKAVPLSQSPIPGINAPVVRRASARSALSPTPIITDISNPIDAARIGSEGRPATWRNQRVEELARRGNRQAIAQTALRGEELPPNARYVMGDPDFPRAVYNPKETTRFTPAGEPIRDVSNPSVVSVPESYSKPREIVKFGGEELPADYQPEEPIAAQVKGVTAQEPKQTVKREVLPRVEQYLTPDQITEAEGLIHQETGMMQSGERPGRYYDENPLGEYNPQGEQSASRGVTSGGRWRGVRSGRDMMPFMKEHPEWGPEQLQKAMRNKDSALYKRAIRAAHDFINRGGGYESEERLGLQSD